MGRKLESYYQYIEEKLGRDGKVKLAQLTCIPSVLAAGRPDTPEMVEKFRQAIRTLTGSLPPI